MARALENFLDKYAGQPEFIEIWRLKAVAQLLQDSYETFYLSKKTSKQRELRLLISRSPKVLRAQRKVKDVR